MNSPSPAAPDAKPERHPRHAFHICRVWGSRHGGSLYSRALVDQLRARGWKVTVMSEQFIDTGEAPDRKPLPAFFRREISAWPWKLKDILTLIRLVTGTPGALVIVQGDLPRVTYVLLQFIAPLLFIRQDGILTCPGNNRFLGGSRSICVGKAGLSCLMTHRTEGCLGQLPWLKRWGRVIFRARDALLLRQIRAFVTSSRYLATVHRKSAWILHPPLLTASKPRCENSRVLERMVFCGRLETVKGAGDALRIASLLPDRYHLKILGEGIERASLTRLVEELGLSGRVDFMGWVDRATRDSVLASAGVLLMPSLGDEAFGMAGIEALARGTPVVAYEVGGVPEWCRSGAGILVPCGNTAAAAAAVKKLTEDLDQWRFHSRAARRLCEREFPARRFGEELHHLIADVQRDFWLGQSFSNRFDPAQEKGRGHL